MADPKLEIIIAAKDRASRVVRQVKGEVLSASRSMTSALQGGGALMKGGLFGMLAGGLDSLVAGASALAPEVALPLQLVGGAAKGVLLVFRQVAATVSGIVVGALKAAVTVIETLTKAAWELGNRALRAVVSSLRQIMIAAAAAGAAIGYVVKTTSDAAASMEQATIAYGSLLKSVAAGRSAVAQLQQFAKETPFEFQNLLTLGRQVMAYGFAWGEVLPVLRLVGDATAALGGGPEMMERMLRAIGQIRGKGKVMMQEMYQLAEAGIPVFEIFAQELGLTQQQVANIGETGISAAMALPALFRGIQKRYGGLMAAQMGTVAGQVSNLEDIIFQLKATVGEAFLPIIKQYLPLLTNWVTTLGPRLKTFVVQVVGFLQAFGKSDLWKSIVTQFQLLFGNVMGKLGGAAGAWGTFGAVVNWVAGVLNRVLTWINGLFASGQVSGFITWAQQTYQGIVQWLGNAWAWLQGWWAYLQNAVPQWMGFLGYWAGYLYGVFVTYWPLVSKFLGDFWNLLKQTVGWIWTNLPGIIEVVTKVAAGVGKAFIFISAMVETAYLNIKLGFGVLRSVLLAVLAEVLFIAQKIIAAFALITETMAKLPGMGKLRPLADNLREGAETLKALRDQAKAGMVEGAKDSWEAGLALASGQTRTDKYFKAFDQMDALQSWGAQKAGELRTYQQTPRQMQAITININAPVYGVEDLEAAINKGIADAMRASRYQGVAPAGA